jgi:disulfide oxidoreductase YuzD
MCLNYVEKSRLLPYMNIKKNLLYFCNNNYNNIIINNTNKNNHNHNCHNKIINNHIYYYLILMSEADQQKYALADIYNAVTYVLEFEIK